MGRLPLVCAFTLLLSACGDYSFVSEIPVIPEDELAQPEGLAGKYWGVSNEGQSLISAGIVNLRWEQGRKLHFDGKHNEDGDISARLIDLELPGLFLSIFDAEEEGKSGHGTSGYGIFALQDQGTVGFATVRINTSDPAGSTASFVEEIAGRHGVSVDYHDNEAELVDPKHGANIVKLFRDPEFLGALKFESGTHLLPVREGQESFKNELELYSGSYDTLDFHIFGMPQFVSGKLASPRRFSGRYKLRYLPNYLDVDVMTLEKGAVEIRGRDDGKFELVGLDETISLLPFDDGPSYLAIQEPDEAPDPDNPKPYNSVWTVRSDDKGCWRFDAIRSLENSRIEVLDELRKEGMKKAAQRHGFELGALSVGGELEADRLTALFQDGQFTAGLDTEHDFTLCPKEQD